EGSRVSGWSRWAYVSLTILSRMTSLLAPLDGSPRIAIHGEIRHHVGQGGVGKILQHAALSLLPDALHVAARKYRAVTVLGDTRVDRNWPFHGFDDVAKRHVIGTARQGVAAMRTTVRLHELRANQVLNDLLQELSRDATMRGHLLDGHWMTVLL